MTRFPPLHPTDPLLEAVAACAPLPVEDVCLEECLGRTLASAFSAPTNLPGFARSTVDGFAVRSGDLAEARESAPVVLEYGAECRMGSVPDERLESGRAARVCTGGMLPVGADAVVPLEWFQALPGGSAFTRPIGRGVNIQPADEEAHGGEELIPAGRVIGPREIGLLASFGLERIEARIRPRVAVVSTGDEVVPLGRVSHPGQVHDVNSHTLTAMARAVGAQARAVGPVVDDPLALRAKIDESLTSAEVVLVSGGSSAGHCDRTLSVFGGLPGCEILSAGRVSGPGGAPIAARVEGRFLWGLPGHAAAALMCAEIFVVPLLRRLLGQPECPGFRDGLVSVELAEPVTSSLGRRDHIRVALEPPRSENGPPLARPLKGRPRSLAAPVDALILCPEDREGFAAGETLHARLVP